MATSPCATAYMILVVNYYSRSAEERSLEVHKLHKELVDAMNSSANYRPML